MDEVYSIWLNWYKLSNHYENIPIQYTENFTMTKNENFQIKNSDIFNISVQNIDCWNSLEPPRRGGSDEYPQSMFLSRNKGNNVHPCKPQFYYVKVGLKGGQNYIGMFSWCNRNIKTFRCCVEILWSWGLS